MISFDWAMKRLLRNKANFEVLEGFLSVLLRRKIIIKNIAESDANQESKDDKYNKADIIVEADDKELVIIELQYDSEDDYFQRMLYGVSKSITEHIFLKEAYSTIRKVYSVNIVYFDLGTGDDYVYHGFTNFKGLHTNTELILTEKQFNLYGKTFIGELYPEYYIIKVKKFNKISDDDTDNVNTETNNVEAPHFDPLDEWIYYLKNNKIKDEFKAPGIDKAREVLNFDKLTDEEKRQYWYNVEAKRIKNSEMTTAYTDGEIKGRAKGLEEGEAIGLEKGEANTNKKVIANGLKAGYSIEIMSTMTGLSIEEVKKIIKSSFPTCAV